MSTRRAIYMETPVGSFMRFVVGFSVFIFVSFGVTFAVNLYTTTQEKDQQTAAAFEAMVQ